MIQINARGRQFGVFSGVAFLFIFAFLVISHRRSTVGWSDSTAASATQGTKPVDSTQDVKVHILLPASKRDINLCKTLISSAMLDYPTPTIIAWNETFDTPYLLGGGSHKAKINGVLEWLQNRDAPESNDIVIMMDSYGMQLDLLRHAHAETKADIWWQLRPEVLLSRYKSINDALTARNRERMGKAFDAEGLRQTIVFGAGKRCAPNQHQTIACYPIPESPLPKDLYGTHTDTVLGRNTWYSTRQRFLNSGYIMGPIADMRAMFQRAKEKMDAVPDHFEWDNGSGGSDFMYHGSDQSVFANMFGEQEFQREVMRRKHLSWREKAQGKEKLPLTFLEGTVIDDRLNPAFKHEPGTPKDGKPDEFNMGLDYFSDLISQTVNSEEDGRYLVYNKDITKQIGKQALFDCPPRVKGTVPQDVMSSHPPLHELPTNEQKGWDEVPLYTNICLDRVPVMIHHNGDKGAREWAWTRTWMQPHARAVMRKILDDPHSERGSAYTAEGAHLSWDELCPAEYEQELFRDVDTAPP